MPVPVFACAIAALVLRLAHFGLSIDNPLRYQPAPDEDFYLTFAAALGNGDASHPIYGFMDPLYGYIVWALGADRFAIAFVQVLLDSVTTALVAFLALRWHGGRASWIAGLGYAFSAAAIMYTTAILKAPWVAAMVVAWLVCACRVWRSESMKAWLFLGVLGGMATALRGNLLGLGLLMLAVLLWNDVLGRRRHSGRSSDWQRPAWLVAGMLPIMFALGAHQHATTQQLRPLPSNGGIVLHQIYNPDNPTARQFAPAFVKNPHPREIWYGYKAEAERRAGRAMSAGEVDRYWRNQAVGYISSEPSTVIHNMARKFLELFAASERPNNLSISDERRFSWVLRWLPDLGGLWTALGLAGLWVLRRRPEAPVIAIPIIVLTATFIVFFAESRFRFHMLPVSCALAGVALAEAWRRLQQGAWASSLRLVAPLSLASIVTSLIPALGSAPRADWERIAQGYVNMNEYEPAIGALTAWEAEQGQTADMLRIRAMIEHRAGNFETAIAANRAAIQLNPGDSTAWYNLALSLDSLGDHSGGLDAAATAARLDPAPRNRLLWATALEFSGKSEEARSLYESVLDNLDQVATPIERQHALNGLSRIRQAADGAVD